jgi:imidazole glycerol-phosphate synthase subunit HisH
LKHLTVGVVDYDMGNHGSISHALRSLDFRVRVAADIEVLDKTDVLVLPGVGAFPAAMQALNARGLAGWLQARAREQKPIIGICLGMQLLATLGHEHGYTAGLDLIPGEVVALENPKWHIGWNTAECTADDPLFRASDGHSFYFNHSYVYQGPSEFQVCVSRVGRPFASAIRRGNVIGLQFHPEKSQDPGRDLLRTLIRAVSHA